MFFHFCSIFEAEERGGVIFAHFLPIFAHLPILLPIFVNFQKILGVRKLKFLKFLFLQNNGNLIVFKVKKAFFDLRLKNLTRFGRLFIKLFSKKIIFIKLFFLVFLLRMTSNCNQKMPLNLYFPTMYKLAHLS